MGRWYCCNDSFVSLSTMQEVLSEKVYILFFSRTNQRQESANTRTSNISNGLKSHDSNGHEALKIMKSALPTKGANTKLYESSHKDISTISKFDKIASSPQIKFNITGSKKATIGNGKAVLKNQAMETNGNVNGSICVEKTEKAKLVNRNCLNKTEEVDSISSEKGQPFVLVKENGDVAKAGVSSEKPDNCEGNGTSSSLITIREPDHKNLVNGGESLHSEASGSKRKSQHSCILFAQDAESLAKVEKLKAAYVLIYPQYAFHLNLFFSYVYHHHHPQVDKKLLLLCVLRIRDLNHIKGL